MALYGCFSFTSSTASKSSGLYAKFFEYAIRALTSFGKHEPP